MWETKMKWNTESQQSQHIETALKFKGTESIMPYIGKNHLLTWVRKNFQLYEHISWIKTQSLEAGRTELWAMNLKRL